MQIGGSHDRRRPVVIDYVVPPQERAYYKLENSVAKLSSMLKLGMARYNTESHATETRLGIRINGTAGSICLRARC